MQHSTPCIHQELLLRIPEFIGAPRAETKLQLREVTLCHHKTINSTLPPAGKSSGNFWFIRFSNNKGPSNPAVKRTGPRPAAYLGR